MMKQLSPQYVEDAERGISLEMNGRNSFLYRQGDLSLTIDAEPFRDERSSQYGTYLYLSAAEHWDDLEGVPLADEDRHEISAHLKEAFSLWGVDARIE